ncbi:response regulator [Azospirillum melinis]|uniref:response regulator n=1 Tax=Azospirillum melinis TaxID=328839 RepID=UPI00157AE315|nr:response regulator [Azospirillum melinis]MBP2309710.1 DNA-binding NtrC family response regulator [Azospirillum melinis]
MIDVWLAHGSSGLTAVRHLTDRNGIPVIVCSGHAAAQDARTAGAIDFLKKPFRLSDLECAFAMVMEAEALADPIMTGAKLKLLAAHALSPAGRYIALRHRP